MQAVGTHILSVVAAAVSMEQSPYKSQSFLFIIFHCRYLHLYLYTYDSVPLVPQCKYLYKLVTETIL